jgi:hypothetical protein
MNRNHVERNLMLEAECSAGRLKLEVRSANSE